MKTLFGAMVLGLASINAAAEGITVYGAGTESCGKFVEVRRVGRMNADREFRVYFSGFVSAYNWYHGKKALRGPDGNIDIDAAMVWMDTFCRANSESAFAFAAASYINKSR